MLNGDSLRESLRRELRWQTLRVLWSACYSSLHRLRQLHLFCGKLRGERRSGSAGLPGSEMEKLHGEVIYGLTIENRTRRRLYFRARTDRGALVLEVMDGDKRSAGGLVIPPDCAAAPK